MFGLAFCSLKSVLLRLLIEFPVLSAEGTHPFPFRIRKLSPPASMVLAGQLAGRVDQCRVIFKKRPCGSMQGLLLNDHNKEEDHEVFELRQEVGSCR